MLDGELESYLKTAPFETYTFYRGKASLGTSIFGRAKKAKAKAVGKFKGLLRIVDDPAEPLPNSMDTSILFKPTPLTVQGTHAACPTYTRAHAHAQRTSKEGELMVLVHIGVAFCVRAGARVHSERPQPATQGLERVQRPVREAEAGQENSFGAEEVQEAHTKPRVVPGL